MPTCFQLSGVAPLTLSDTIARILRVIFNLLRLSMAFSLHSVKTFTGTDILFLC